MAGRGCAGRGSLHRSRSAASLLGFQPKEVRREPSLRKAAQPVPSHCCLDPEPAPVDIPPVEGGEETPDSQVGAHLAGQVRGNRGPKGGGGGVEAGSKSSLVLVWKLAVQVRHVILLSLRGDGEYINSRDLAFRARCFVFRLDFFFLNIRMRSENDGVCVCCC